MILFHSILTALCWFILYFIVVRRFVYVLQLERYHTKPYLDWIKGGAHRIYFRGSYAKVLHPVAIILTLTVIFNVGPVIFELGTLSALAVIWTAGHYKPVMPIKKPFVYTPRVIRLLALLVIIEAAILAFAVSLFGYRGFIGTVVALGYLQWYMVAIANRAARPLEGMLQEGFKKKARKKLAGKKIIGVTGSYGKSGTKEAIAHLLETKFPVFKTPGSYNTPMGLCKAVNEKIEPSHELFVTEMGATKRGDIKELCEICPPDIAVITSTGEAHLESFGTPEEVALTKFEIADTLSENGVLFINNDYDRGRHLAAEFIAKRRFLSTQRPRLITYGMETESDYMPCNLRCGKNGSVFDLKTPDGVLEKMTIKLLGKLNVINVTAAFAVGRHLGLNPDSLKAAAATLPQMEHRLQVRDNPGSYLVIDDGFNANPVGAAVAVETLGYFEDLQKILVTPGIVDMGGRQEEANFEFGKTAARYCDRVILINRQRTQPIKNGLKEAGFAEDKIESFPSLAEAKPFINSVADEKSVVLFENDLPDHMEEQKG